VHGTIPYAPIPSVGEGWIAVPTSRKVLRVDLDSGKQVGEISLTPDPRYAEDDRLVRFHTVAAGGILIASYVADATASEDYMQYDITVAIPRRGLKGIRVAGDRTVWDTVKRQTADPFLSELSFNGEPALAGGRLYALGWRKKGYIDVFLVCLDARTGERLWSAPIAGNQVELTMFGETAHEPLLGAVVVEDGSAYCSTNLGVVARVRASDGHVLWATEYEAQRRRQFRGRRSHARARVVWERNPILLHDGRLVATPLDSTDLLVFDAADGRVLQRRGGGEDKGFLVGILDDRIVLAKDEIRLMPIRDIQRGDDLRFKVADEIRATPALVDGGIVYTTADGLYHQSLRSIGGEPSPPDHLCPLQELEYDVEERDPIPDGAVTVLRDRILVTSSQRVSCFLAEPPPTETSPR
jgi:outer membrane protein assembly factor BamB